MKRPKKKPDKFDYALARKKLAKFGFKKPAKTRAQKAAIKSLWDKKAAYINHTEKDRLVPVLLGAKKGLRKKKGGGRQKIAETSDLVYRFKFQKLSKAQMAKAKASHLISESQFTPTGIFIERPINIPASKYKMSFRGKSVEITADCRHDEIVAIDPEKILADPNGAINEAIANRVCLDENGQQKPIKTFSLMVNGFRSKHSSTSSKQFLWYIKNKLLPDWLAQNDDEENPAGKIADIFHVRLLY